MTVRNTNIADVRLNIPYGVGHFFLGVAVAFTTTKIAVKVLSKLYERAALPNTKQSNQDWHEGFVAGERKVLRDVAFITGVGAGCASSAMVLPYSTVVECSSSTFITAAGIATALLGGSALSRNPKVIFSTCIGCFIAVIGPAIGLAGRVSLVLFGLGGSFFGSEFGKH